MMGGLSVNQSNNLGSLIFNLYGQTSEFIKLNSNTVTAVVILN